ncbi:MAG TPA: CDP-alcohol phosphatidyltransferase family protein [Bacteroidota bacterium]|jgi:phosphatidylglycerophosphate synthase|nr:CDP-alcohol phosphatidyltransferase family protein [Bacteroidota bacterium]
MSKTSDGLLSISIRFAHEKLGLLPNQISTIGFIAGIVGALTLAIGYLVPGLIILAVSQIIDGLDGGVARRYNLQSEKGQMLEVVYDRLNELAIFLALAFAGYVSLTMVALAFMAILLVTIIEPMSKFDPGFKRFMIYFGYLATVLFNVRGFEIALHVIFVANLIGFAVGTIMVDYRLQREIDSQAILRREVELAAGISQPPDDPPSFLSKLFS